MKSINKIFVLLVTITTIFSSFVFAINAQDDVIDLDPSGSSIINEIFGPDGLNIKVPGAENWNGNVTVWSILSYVFLLVWFFLFIAVLFAVGVGAIKWISSQGEEAKLQSAKKWVNNALMGFAATLATFIVANLITFLIGIGSVFDMAQNLATCGSGTNERVLYEWKKERGIGLDEKCECPKGATEWDC